MAKKTTTSKKENKSGSSKIIFLIIGALIGLGILFITATLLLRYLQGKDNVVFKDYQGILVALSPGLSVERDGKRITDVSEEFDLVEGDIVRTDGTGIAYIIFPDNSSISLDVNTEVSIENVEETEASFIVNLKQTAGRTWSRVENLLDKDSDYEIETPNTIAAVRGTQFGCDVTDSVSTCYAIEHEITLTLKNLSSIDNTIVLPEGKWFKNDDAVTPKIETEEELIKIIDDLMIEDMEWIQFNECVNSMEDEILSVENRKLEYLMLRRKDIACEVSQPEVVENTPTPTVTPTPTQTVTKAPVRTSSPTPTATPAPVVSNVSLTSTGSKMSCTWTATNATSYVAVITLTPGTNPTTAATSPYEVTGYNPNATYYCIVAASGPGGKSSNVTSAGYYFETSSGTINIANSQYNSTLSGNGSYFNAPLSHFKIKYYIKRDTDGKYLRAGGTWGVGLNWITVTPVTTGGSVYSFSSSEGGVDGPFNVEIKAVLYNVNNNRELAVDVATMSNNW